MKTFIDRRGLLNHLVPTGDDGKFYSYENILKNMTKLSPWNEFIIKIYDSEGTDLTEYTSVNKGIFKSTTLIPITRKFNPELLI